MNHVGRGLHVLMPFGTVTPIVIGNFKLLIGRLFTRFKAFKFFFFTDSEPKFDHNGIALYQVVFKAIDFAISTLPVCLFCKALNTLNEYSTIPTTVKNGHSAIMQALFE